MGTDVPHAPTPSSKLGAILSSDRKYRYLLTRTWGSLLPEPRRCVFVMLNPSTADENSNDPTIRRCIDYAKSFGCDSLEVVNLFALRATDPGVLRYADDPVGPENDDWIDRVAGSNPGQNAPTLVVCAWGTFGSMFKRDDEVLKILSEHVKLQCLALTRDGMPAHPLYLPKTLTPTPYYK